MNYNKLQKCKQLRKHLNGIICENYRPLVTIGILNETYNVWERRCPLVPHDIKDLIIKNGYKFIVQPSNHRIYNNYSFENVGATISNHLNNCDVIIGLKPFNSNQIIPKKTYCLFSHTIKAQPQNMHFLDSFIENENTLIDYEKLVDNNEKRVVYFGNYAGIAGMINGLHGIGVKFLHLGFATPFLSIRPAHFYESVREAKLAIYNAGLKIKDGQLNSQIEPIVVAFTGSGNVTQGALEIFKELPFILTDIESLETLKSQYKNGVIFGIQISRKDYLRNRTTGTFDLDEYNAYPERYESIFEQKFAPSIDLLINGIYWRPTDPRLITNEYFSKNHKKPYAIVDVSADKHGSLEFIDKTTTFDKPFDFFEEYVKGQKMAKIKGPLINCIDNLPAQLPLEASGAFSSKLAEFLPEIVASLKNKQSDMINRAIIVKNGHLTDNFKYINELRNKNSPTIQQSNRSNEVLLLGSGLTSEPFINYIVHQTKASLTIVSSCKDQLVKFQTKFPSIRTIYSQINEENHKRINDLIKEHKVVVSLLPYDLHGLIAGYCIKHKRPMLTASYLTDQMKQFHQEAIKNDVIILQEMGLDPGIDHMLAMEFIDRMANQDTRISSFMSYCGGLVAPQHALNPLRYKFTWNPYGSLFATMNSAKYLTDSQIVEIKEGELLNYATDIDNFPCLSLEGYPNRNSLPFIDHYKLNKNVLKSFMRGTIRYKGFSKICGALQKMGYFNKNYLGLKMENERITIRSFTNMILTNKINCLTIDVLKNKGFNEEEIHAINDLGLLSDDQIDIKDSPLRTISLYLANKLTLNVNESDLVLLLHSFQVITPSGQKKQYDIKVCEYGQFNGFSAMSNTVGLPLAIGTELILNNKLKMTGCVTPVYKEIYEPVLSKLRNLGIKEEMTIRNLN